MLLIIFLLFVFGLFFGSFYLVVIDRLPKQRSPFTGRSSCDHCGHTLAWNDLVPVISYVLLNGKCRYCRAPLSGYYPIMEVITAISFAIVPLLLLSEKTYSLGSRAFYFDVLFSLCIVSVFIIVFFTDLRYGIIPFAVVIPASIISFIYHILTSPASIFTYLLSAIGAGLFFYVIYWFTKGRGMGFGDVVLALFLGVLLGFPDIVTSLYVAFLTGACVSLILILTGKKKLKGSTIPFGPFLIFGAFIGLFWGDVIFRNVSSLLFH